MAIGLFKKPYTVRKFVTQTVVNGYASSAYTDKITRLNVQPQAPDTFNGGESGDTTVKHLKSWGADKLTSADEYSNTPGDLLFYQGIWYECTSSVMWDHTLLSHYQSDFVNLPADKQPPPPTPPPENEEVVEP